MRRYRHPIWINLFIYSQRKEGGFQVQLQELSLSIPVFLQRVASRIDGDVTKHLVVLRASPISPLLLQRNRLSEVNTNDVLSRIVLWGLVSWQMIVSQVNSLPCCIFARQGGRAGIDLQNRSFLSEVNRQSFRF